MGRRFAYGAVLLACTLLFAGVLHAAPEEIRISGWKRPFNVPVMVELERGSYKRAFPEVDISIVDLQSGPKLMAAMAAGDLDVVQGIGDAAFLVFASRGVDARIIAINNRSPGSFAVVTNNPEVRSVADLKGRKVAGLRGSVVHQVFLDALAEVGLREADVEFFPMPLATAASTLLAGRVDAALLVGSDIARAQKSGARILADGVGRVRGLSLVVAGTRFLEAHPGFVPRFLQMRRDTLEYMKSQRDETLRIAAQDTKEDREAVSAMMGLYDFDCAITSEDRESMERTRRYLIENGIVPEIGETATFFM